MGRINANEGAIRRCGLRTILIPIGRGRRFVVGVKVRGRCEPATLGAAAPDAQGRASYHRNLMRTACRQLLSAAVLCRFGIKLVENGLLESFRGWRGSVPQRSLLQDLHVGIPRTCDAE